MKRVAVYALIVAVVLSLGLSAVKGRRSQLRSASTPEASNPPFRNGLYQGKFAAERARGEHPSVERGANDADRASFVPGDRQGCEEALAAKGQEKH